MTTLKTTNATTGRQRRAPRGGDDMRNYDADAAKTIRGSAAFEQMISELVLLGIARCLRNARVR
jgi:hypothetical protein